MTNKPHLESLEGAFGKITVDIERPCVRSLVLRQANGDLCSKSLLSKWPSETLPYTTGAYSYIEDFAGVRYESTSSRSHTVPESEVGEIVIRGIQLLPDKLRLDAPVIEDWHFRVNSNGDLRWQITRHWQRECDVRRSATPALFFNMRSNAVPTGSGQRRLNPERNGTAVLMWIDPSTIESQPYPWDLMPPPCESAYESCERNGNFVVYNRRDGWVLAKLYTAFPNDRDLYLKAENGFLFRKGKYNSHNELGLLIDPKAERYEGVPEASMARGRKLIFGQGTEEQSALIIGGRNAAQSGHQLVVDIPDKNVQKSLTGFYNGLANAGMWTSQSGYGVGNQVDGWKIGTFWMPAMAILAGIPMSVPLSTDTYAPLTAYRANLETLLNLMDDEGSINYGFIYQRKKEGYFAPENSMVFLVSLDLYWRATGDTALVGKYLGKIENVINAINAFRRDDLLTIAEDDKILIYFDGWHMNGVITYLNNWYVRALEAFSTFLDATGQKQRSEEIKAQREATIRAMNRLLWSDDAFGPGKGGYVDFIDSKGGKHHFFCSATEYLAIAVGVADQKKGAAILKTADERIVELKKQYGYVGDATLDTLWPADFDERYKALYPFTTYQNGSVLNCWTYFEIIARCKCGDVESAHKLLQRFAEHAGRTNWFEGDSAFNIKSEPHGWGNEPYLSDQVAVACALIHGLMGIEQTPQGVKVSGDIPSGWDNVRAVVPSLGKYYEVMRTKSRTTIRHLEELRSPILG